MHDLDASLNHHMSSFSLLASAVYWGFRTAAYALLNLGEDAALIAFMFC